METAASNSELLQLVVPEKKSSLLNYVEPKLEKGIDEVQEKSNFSEDQKEKDLKAVSLKVIGK